MIDLHLPVQIDKVHDPLIHLSTYTFLSAFTSDAPVRNIGVTFDPHLSISNHISIFQTLPFLLYAQSGPPPHLTHAQFKTASTIAIFIVQSKLDYCNSFFLNLGSTQIKRLQLIHNSLARAVTRTPRHHHITPVLKSLH